MKEFYIELASKNNEFQIMVLGDMHIGDDLCDIKLIKETIDYVKNTKNCYVILNGDLLNNALKTSKSDVYKETMTMEEEQDLLIDLLKPIKNKILVMATGNHEYRTNLIAGINPLKAVAYALDIKDRLVENSYVLDIGFGSYNNNQKFVYTIYGIHGGNGSGRRAGNTVNALQDMALIVPNADLYIHSHTHTIINHSDMIFLHDKRTKKLKEHQRTFYNANAFLKYGGYAEQKGYRPTDRTPSVVTVKGFRKNNNVILKTNIVRI